MEENHITVERFNIKNEEQIQNKIMSGTLSQECLWNE